VLIAKIKETKNRVLARDTPKLEGPFICPSCDAPCIVKKGEIVVHHFAHVVSSDCVGSGESEKHLKTKLAIYDALDDNPIVKKIELEWQGLREYGVRPDIMFKTDNDTKIVIEIQNSNIDMDVIRYRNKTYTELGIFIMWVFPDPYPSIYPGYKNVHRLKYWEKLIYKFHNDNLYYWLEGETILPVEFGTYYSYSEVTEWGGGGHKTATKTLKYIKKKEPIAIIEQIKIDKEIKEKRRLENVRLLKAALEKARLERVRLEEQTRLENVRLLKAALEKARLERVRLEEQTRLEKITREEQVRLETIRIHNRIINNKKNVIENLKRKEQNRIEEQARLKERARFEKMSLEEQAIKNKRDAIENLKREEQQRIENLKWEEQQRKINNAPFSRRSDIAFIAQSHLLHGMSLHKLNTITDNLDWNEQSDNWVDDVITKIKKEVSYLALSPG